MKKNSVLAFFIITLACMVAAPAYSADELFDTAAATKHIEQGVKLLKAKKYDAAAGEFEEAASINPDAEAYYYLGYTYYLKGRNGDETSRKKSRENFDKAYAINPLPAGSNQRKPRRQKRRKQSRNRRKRKRRPLSPRNPLRPSPRSQQRLRSSRSSEHQSPSKS
jgi:tetratricopeptide (TPR) repeat protein